MFSRTSACLRWTASATVVFVVVLRRWPILAVLRSPYFDAIAPLILASSRLKDATMRIIVLAIRTVSEIVVACLLVVSNREVTKITVHTNGRRALYWSSISGDREAEPVLGEGER